MCHGAPQHLPRRSAAVQMSAPGECGRAESAGVLGPGGWTCSMEDVSSFTHLTGLRNLQVPSSTYPSPPEALLLHCL